MAKPVLRQLPLLMTIFYAVARLHRRAIVIAIFVVVAIALLRIPRVFSGIGWSHKEPPVGLSGTFARWTILVLEDELCLPEVHTMACEQQWQWA
jgi:hypothetical protein